MTDAPSDVAMPLAAPTGARMPPVNGFESVSMNVSPLSSETLSGVAWLNPLRMTSPRR